MKVVILAGGLGTRLSEETQIKPKPMVEIGGKPILWHIMKIYSQFGFNDFIICLGYKGYIIKEYFFNYALHQSDVQLDLANNSAKIVNSKTEPWKVSLIDTGLNTMTGGRIKNVQKYIGQNKFLLTYGDGVSNVNITNLVNFHESQDKLVTMTAVQAPGRFGAVDIDSHNSVKKFMEKPKGDGFWINGGFFVCEPEVFDYIDGDHSIWEQKPLMQISEQNKMSAFKHDGFWHPMDTLRDKHYLEKQWVENKAEWKVWDS